VRRPGAITIAQTRDSAAIAGLVDAAGAAAAHLDRPGSCFLLAYYGDDPVGIADIQTLVDSAFMRLLWVAVPMRCRGIGTALVAAARKAAHTRGARTLYALDAPEGDYLSRQGFVPAKRSDPIIGEADQGSLWMLDLSRDGVIER
jgi:N-acetylglutamate synthase-like GNAT family acetyltransferase